MKKRMGLLCVGVGLLGPLFLLVGGGYLTSTDAAYDCSLFFKSYGIGLLFPGILFLCAGAWLPGWKGAVAWILTVIFAVPAGASALAILLRFGHWQIVFTVGQAVTWSIVLMWGTGLYRRSPREPMVAAGQS